MTAIVDRITALFSPRKFSDLVGEAVKRELDKKHEWMLATAGGAKWDTPNPYIYASQADMYRLSPILGTALDVVGNDIALSDYGVKRRVGEEVREVKNHEFETRVYGSLQYPNPLQSKHEFLKATTIGRILNGNHVWWLNRNSWYDKPAEIWEWSFERVTPVPDGRQYLSHYIYHPGTTKEDIIIPLYQIIHFKTYNPHNPFVGLSPIESLAETIVGDLGMRKTTAQSYTERGGSPPDILAFNEWINDQAWAEMKRNAEKASNENKTLMLRGTNGDVKWMSRSVSNKDSDFVSLLTQNMRDIFNRVAPGLLASLDANANRSTADAARAEYEEKTHWPLNVEIASKVNSEIMPAYGRNLFIEFDDPRVVDRQIAMQEFDRDKEIMLIGELREAKGLDELGDERDNLFVSQVNSATGDGTKEPAPPQLQPFTEQPEAEVMEEPDMEMEEQPSDSAKAAINDLLKLRRIAVKGQAEKIQAFTSDYIPAEILRGLKRRLALVTSRTAIEALFDAKIAAYRPQPKMNPLVILRGLEATVKALELRSK